eukprot:858450-Rhodomonas_salina.1
MVLALHRLGLKSATTAGKKEEEEEKDETRCPICRGSLGQELVKLLSRWTEPLASEVGRCYTPKSKTRNHIAGANRTEIEVSCIGLRGVCEMTGRGIRARASRRPRRQRGSGRSSKRYTPKSRTRNRNFSTSESGCGCQETAAKQWEERRRKEEEEREAFQPQPILVIGYFEVRVGKLA